MEGRGKAVELKGPLLCYWPGRLLRNQLWFGRRRRRCGVDCLAIKIDSANPPSIFSLNYDANVLGFARSLYRKLQTRFECRPMGWILSECSQKKPLHLRRHYLLVPCETGRSQSYTRDALSVSSRLPAEVFSFQQHCDLRTAGVRMPHDAGYLHIQCGERNS